MFLRSSRKTVALAAALVSILTLNTGAALAACEERVNRELQDMSVSQDDVKSVEVMRLGDISFVIVIFTTIIDK